MPYKQVILVREDLKLPKGKLSVQCSHASVECVLKSERGLVDKWRKEGGKKVVLKVSDKKELLQLKKLADGSSLKNALITDAGKTTVEPGTVTCLGIGPDDEKKIDSLTLNLKIL
ncbi:peptidyl-tRNA hydrolase Pth2 [Candidatus Woesearchaeota archaeon]|nr:peptidyl-tRNA hydrolase Pth2 [Candidatus Woesearchaeota archaeon]